MHHEIRAIAELGQMVLDEYTEKQYKLYVTTHDTHAHNDKATMRKPISWHK